MPIWHSFWRLHSSRSTNGGICSIDIQSIISYGINVARVEDLEEFIDYVQALDSVMVKHLYEASKK